jgi:hypothetical protein
MLQIAEHINEDSSNHRSNADVEIKEREYTSVKWKEEESDAEVLAKSAK